MIEAPKPIHFLVLDCRVDVKSGGRANARAVGGLNSKSGFGVSRSPALEYTKTFTACAGAETATNASRHTLPRQTRARTQDSAS